MVDFLEEPSCHRVLRYGRKILILRQVLPRERHLLQSMLDAHLTCSPYVRGRTLGEFLSCWSMHATDEGMDRILLQANNDVWIQVIKFQGNFRQE